MFFVTCCRLRENRLHPNRSNSMKIQNFNPKDNNKILRVSTIVTTRLSSPRREKS